MESESRFVRDITRVTILLFAFARFSVAWGETTTAVAQDQSGVTTVRLETERMTDEGHGFTRLFLVSDDDKVNVLGKSYSIVRPNQLRDKTLGYFRIYFVGRAGTLEKNLLVLVEGYDSERPRFYVDGNNNLDFTDDPKTSVEWESALGWSDGSCPVLTLFGDDPRSRFSIRLLPIRGDSKMTAEKKEQYRQFLSRSVPTDVRLADIDHWFYNQRLNTMTRSVEIDGEKTMIGLHDYDCDGLYNGERDRVVIGEFEGEYISSRFSDGAVAARPGEIFLIKGNRIE